MSREHLKIRSGISFKGVTANPSDPEEGDVIFRSDLSKILIRQSSNWENFATESFLTNWYTKQPVRVATVAALPTYTYNNGTGGVGATLTATINASINNTGIDGLTDLVVGNRVLVKNEGFLVIAQSSINTTTDQITSATHGLNTGDPINVVVLAPWAIPTSTPQIYDFGKIYYVNKIDNNIFQVAQNSDGSGVVDFTVVQSGSFIVVLKPTIGGYNGIYTVTQLGDGSDPWILTRATDSDSSTDLLSGITTKVMEGNTLYASDWSNITKGTITPGTTPILFANAATRLTRPIDVGTQVISSTSMNASLIIMPNGTGALRTSSSGNARGANAVDLQMSRVAVTDVASASYSVIGGGIANRNDGQNSTIIGGYRNYIGSNDAIAGGQSNVVSSSALISLGFGNTSIAANAVSIGKLNRANQANSILIGNGGSSSYTGELVYSDSDTMGTCTMTIGSPCTVTFNSHGFGQDDIIYITTDGALPTGLTAGTAYFVQFNDANSFFLSSSRSGSYINTSGSQSGTHTLHGPSRLNVSFNIRGSDDVHIGKQVDQASVSGATNTLYLHTINASNQSKAIGLSAPSNLIANYNFTLPGSYGTSGQVLQTDGAGITSWITSGGGAGETNYITEWNFEDNLTTGWNRYADAAATIPVDGTGGSPNINTTFTSTSSSPIRGTYSGLLTKDAANRQGEGVSYDFSTSAVDKNRLLKIQFDFVTSANYVANDVGVYIYDVTNSAIITPQSVNLSARSSTFGTTFVSSSSTSYRLILHIASTNASAYTVEIDNVIVGPGQLIQGTPISEWVAFTPTGTWTTNSTYTGYYRRVGDSYDVQMKVVLAGAPNSTALRFNLPFTLDLTKLNASTSDMFGEVTIRDATVGNYYGNVAYDSATTVAPSYIHDTGSVVAGGYGITQVAPFTFAVNDYISVYLKGLPASGLTSGVYLGSGADNSVTPLNWYNAPITQASTTATYTKSGVNVLAYGGTGATNVTSCNTKYRRVGDSMDLSVWINFSGAANVNGTILVTIPDSFTIDSSKVVAQYDRVWPVIFYTNSKMYFGTARYNTSFQLSISRADDSGATNAEWAGNTTAASNVPSGAAISGSDNLRMTIWGIPITGWTAQDYIGKMLSGFSMAKVGVPGLINNDSSNITGTPILGVTDGSNNADVGYVGQFAATTITDNVTVTTSNTAVSSDLTLTAGRWLIIYDVTFSIMAGTGAGDSTQVSTLLEYGAGHTHVGFVDANTVQGQNITNRRHISRQYYYSFAGASRDFRVMAIKAYVAGSSGTVVSIGAANGFGSFYAIRLP